MLPDPHDVSMNTYTITERKNIRVARKILGKSARQARGKVKECSHSSLDELAVRLQATVKFEPEPVIN